MIKIGSTKITECYLGKDHVKQIYVTDSNKVATKVWECTRKLTVNLSNCKATLKIDGLTVKSNSSSFTYDVPYGSNVYLELNANNYYYFSSQNTTTIRYTYDNFTEAKSVSVSATKLTLTIIPCPVARDDSVTINSSTYLPGAMYTLKQNYLGAVDRMHYNVYTDKPYTVSDFYFGTEFTITSINYAIDANDMYPELKPAPYYYVSTEATLDHTKFYEPYSYTYTVTPGTSVNNTELYLYYIPMYMNITFTQNVAANKKLGAVSNGKVIYSENITVSQTITRSINVPAKIQPSTSGNGDVGSSSVVQIGYLNSSGTGILTHLQSITAYTHTT